LSPGFWGLGSNTIFLVHLHIANTIFEEIEAEDGRKIIDIYNLEENQRKINKLINMENLKIVHEQKTKEGTLQFINS